MYLKIKRLFDLSISSLLILLISPIMITIIGILYFSNKKQIIFRQQRVGRDEKVFIIYKFKTMNDNKDKNGNLLPDVERMTKIGNFLRKSSLDELPQLWNIVKGDMSFVGPRPLLVEYLPLYTKKQARRHCVTPGLTGLAQISGRNTLTWEEKFRFDVTYVEKANLKVDFLILLKTALIVVKRNGINSNKNEPMKRFIGTLE